MVVVKFGGTEMKIFRFKFFALSENFSVRQKLPVKPEEAQCPPVAVVIWKGVPQQRCRSRHLTMVEKDESVTKDPRVTSECDKNYPKEEANEC
ncbi:hypothetical protein TNCV_2803991 [Trichonephila clavipes]|nr:hypothetical protein TNCV_2803991 [Trichonephila clavipes]